MENSELKLVVEKDSLNRKILKGLNGYDFYGYLSPENTNKVGDEIFLHEIRWRSKNSSFIILDHKSPKLKDKGKFWVDVKNRETKKF